MSEYDYDDDFGPDDLTFDEFGEPTENDLYAIDAEGFDDIDMSIDDYPTDDYYDEY